MQAWLFKKMRASLAIVVVAITASPDAAIDCGTAQAQSCGASLVQRGIRTGHFDAEAVGPSVIAKQIGEIMPALRSSDMPSQSLSHAPTRADIQQKVRLLQQKILPVQTPVGPKEAAARASAKKAKEVNRKDPIPKTQPDAEILKGRAEAQLLGGGAAPNGKDAKNSSHALLDDVYALPIVDHTKMVQPAKRPESHGNVASHSMYKGWMGDALVPTDQSGHVQDAVTEDVHGKEAHSHTHRQHIGLVFFIGVLVIGVLMLLFIERFAPNVPYTVALFVAGALASTIHKLKARDSVFTIEGWFDSVEMWQDIEPHLLFFAFLPPLLFGEAMRLNVQLASKCFGQVFILACPGVIIGSILTALVAMYIFPYNWGWPISMVFGAILSATDPVAVVALFHSLGVSPRLSMIVSGESLLNDGTAIVLFQLMLKWLCGAELTVVSMVTSLAVMVLPALAVGTGVSLLFLGVISICAEGHRHSDVMIQVVVTICCGYLAFMVAEEGISASGVLATVVSGYVIAYFAWPRFVEKETVETVWETIEFIGNTVIFFLAGVILMDAILARWSLIRGVDFVYLLVLYMCLTAIRSFTLAVLWIPMNAVGTPFNLKEAIVMVHSALRGAVSLALAIIVDLEPEVNKQMGTRVMFHVGGIAALTFLVNATTAAPLLRFLGLTKNSAIKNSVLNHFSHHLDEDTRLEFERQLHHQHQPKDLRFDGAREDIVSRLMPSLKSAGAIQAFRNSRESAKAGFEASRAPNTTMPYNRYQAKEGKQVYREVFLRVVQNHYWTAIKEGVIPKNLRVARILLTSTNEAFDGAAERLRDWDVIKNDIRPGRFTKVLTKLAERPPFCWSSEFRRTFATEFENLRKVWVVLSFQEAHKRAREDVPKYFAAEETIFSVVQHEVADESIDQCNEAQGMLEGVPQQQVELGKSEMLARKLLNVQLENIREMQKKGLLSSSEAHILEHDVLVDLRRLTFSPMNVYESTRLRDGLTEHGAGW